MYDLRNQKQRIYENKGRWVKVIEQTPYVDEDSTIKHTVPVNIGDPLDDGLKLADEFYSDEYLDTSTKQENWGWMGQGSHSDNNEKSAHINEEEDSMIKSDDGYFLYGNRPFLKPNCQVQGDEAQYCDQNGCNQGMLFFLVIYWQLILAKCELNIFLGNDVWSIHAAMHHLLELFVVGEVYFCLTVLPVVLELNIVLKRDFKDDYFLIDVFGVMKTDWQTVDFLGVLQSVSEVRIVKK